MESQKDFFKSLTLIDTHLHFGGIGPFYMPENILLESLSEYGIKFGFVSSGEAAEFDCEGKEIPVILNELETNKKTLSLIKRNQNLLKGFYWTKPNEGFKKEAYDFIKENIKYFSGFKIHPFHSQLPLTSPKHIPYLEFAKKHKMTVAVHTAPDIFSHSDFVYETAEKYPEINFIMVHLDMTTDHKKALKFLTELPNLYGDTTWVLESQTIIDFVKKNGSSKLLFGTDNPIDGLNTYDKYENFLKDLKLKLDSEDFENICYKNAVKLFGLNFNEDL